jgi:hypothetical protein
MARFKVGPISLHLPEGSEISMWIISTFRPQYNAQLHVLIHYFDRVSEWAYEWSKFYLTAMVKRQNYIK